MKIINKTPFNTFKHSSFHFKLDKTLEYISDVIRRTFRYIDEYVRSIELTHVLEIPPDFYIETNLRNLHVWLILNRLADFKDDSTANTLAIYLEREFKLKVEDSIHMLHISRKSNFIADTNYWLETTRKTLTYHFKENQETIHDPIVKIDALTWSSLYYEKIDRYDKKVYLLSSYLLECYKQTKEMTFDDISKQNFPWTVFSLPVDFEEQIQAVNPQLTTAELEIEIKKPEGELRRHRYDWPTERESLRFDNEFSVVDRRVDRFINQMNYIFRKYDHLDVYDKLSEIEEQEEELTYREKKYAWMVRDTEEFKKEREMLGSDGVRCMKEIVRNRRN